MIRKARGDDWPFIRELCCRTGNAGDPIEPARWPFFSEAWVGPYQRLIPEWTYVATLGGRRMGYLTGCPDTAAFEVKKLLFFEIPLVFRVRVLREYPRTTEVDRYLRRAMRLERGPEKQFPSEFLAQMKSDYPAHLHMNVEAVARGTGLGRELIDVYKKKLALRGVHGIHLFCGDGPKAFYEKSGFVTLATLPFKGIPVHAMGIRF